MDYGHAYSDLLQCEWRAVHIIDEAKLRFIVRAGSIPTMQNALMVARLLMPSVREVDIYDGKYIQRWWKKIGEDWIAQKTGYDLYELERLNQ